MKFVSYAQNGEDVVLWRAFRNIERGFYIDVGGYEPTVDSVTKAFYDRGWSGINIEPVPTFHDRFVQERPRDTNLNVAVAEKAGVIRFHNVMGTGLSTTIASIAEKAAAQGRQVQSSVVPSLTLASICEGVSVRDIHFLKIDVEGGERAVLEGGDFARFRPWVVVIEATLPNSIERTDHTWTDLLLGSGYRLCLFDGLNLFFAAEEHMELVPALSTPANVLDNFIAAPVQTMNERVAALEVQVTLLNDSVERQVALVAERETTLADLQAETARVQAVASTALAAEAALTQAATQAEQFKQQTQRLEADMAAQAEMMQALRSSTSWQVTMPLRAVARLAKGQLPLKEFSRIAFYRSIRVVLNFPGARKGMRSLRRLAPGPIDWLARRFRSYDSRYMARMPPVCGLIMPSAPLIAMSSPLDPSALDLSPQETRFCHLLASTR